MEPDIHRAEWSGAEQAREEAAGSDIESYLRRIYKQGKGYRVSEESIRGK
jgi:hypothetical protein